MDRKSILKFLVVCLLLMGYFPPMSAAAQFDTITLEVPQGYFLIVSDETTLRVWEGQTTEAGHRQVTVDLPTTDYAPLFRAELASQVYCSWINFARDQGWSLQYEGSSYDWMDCASSVSSDGTSGASVTGCESAGETINGLPRRATADCGNPSEFFPHETVQGSTVQLYGLGFFYNCRVTDVNGYGEVTDGVINPWIGEDAPECDLSNPGNSTSAPAPSEGSEGMAEVSQPTNFDESRFEVGAEFVAAYVELDSGMVAENCYEDAAPEGGMAYGGALNPYPEDVQKHAPCVFYWPDEGSSGDEGEGQETVNGFERRAGDEVSFTAGEAVVGAKIVLQGGYESEEACYTTQVPDNGTVYGGAVNFWTGEEASLPACRWVQSTDEPVDNPTSPPPVAEPTSVPTQEPMAPTVGACEPDANGRRETGPEGTCAFSAGEMVFGSEIRVAGYQPVWECYMPSPPAGGEVFNGVIGSGNELGLGECPPLVPVEEPEPQVPVEEPTAPTVGACEPDENGIIRTNTSPDDACSFAPGATVTGAFIQLGSSGYESCTIEGAPESGMVYGGFIGYMEGSMLSACLISPEPTQEVVDETEKQTTQVQTTPTEVATEPSDTPTEDPTTEKIETEVVAPEVHEETTTPEAVWTEVPQEQGSEEATNTEVVEAETPADVQITIEQPPVDETVVQDPPAEVPEQQVAPVEETVVEQTPEEPVIEEIVTEPVSVETEQPSASGIETDTAVDDGSTPLVEEDVVPEEGGS